MDVSLQKRLQEVGDLDLALLVSFVAGEHCIVSSPIGSVKALEEELRLSCTETFGLLPAVIRCSCQTSVDEFNNALLIEIEDTHEDNTYNHAEFDRSTTPVAFPKSRDRSPLKFGGVVKDLENRRIADVVIATHIDLADERVQVQALELLRSRRIFTRSSMHVASKDLLFIAVLSKPGARLSRHLNDAFCMYHFHGDDDGLARLENQIDNSNTLPVFMPEDIKQLRELSEHIFLTAEIAEYLHNVVVFMRNSRYIKGGVTAAATRQLRILSRTLAPLHGMDYVPPSLVALAARKIYHHRLTLATAADERSLLWGSDPSAIKELLDGLTVDDVIEEVLASIEAPL